MQLDEQGRLAEKFSKAVYQSKMMIENSIDIDVVKAWDNTIMDYDLFYNLTRTSHVKGCNKIGDAFVKEHFGYRVQLLLSDETNITVFVKRDTFPHSFMSEDTIVVDTAECMGKLSELLKEKRFVTELQIYEPDCVDYEEKIYSKRELNFSALECGGNGSVDYESIEEIGKDIIDLIP